MSHLLLSRWLDVPPAQAFDVYASLDRLGDWKRGVETVSRSGRLRAGMTYAVRYQAGVKVRYVVGTCEEGRRIEQRWANSAGVWGATSVVLEPSRGGTLLRFEACWTVPESALGDTDFGGLAPLLEPVDARALVDAALGTELTADVDALCEVIRRPERRSAA